MKRSKRKTRNQTYKPSDAFLKTVNIQFQRIGLAALQYAITNNRPDIEADARAFLAVLEG